MNMYDDLRYQLRMWASLAYDCQYKKLFLAAEARIAELEKKLCDDRNFYDKWKKKNSL